MEGDMIWHRLWLNQVQNPEVRNEFCHWPVTGPHQNFRNLSVLICEREGKPKPSAPCHSLPRPATACHAPPWPAHHGLPQNSIWEGLESEQSCGESKPQRWPTQVSSIFLLPLLTWGQVSWCGGGWGVWESWGEGPPTLALPQKWATSWQSIWPKCQQTPPFFARFLGWFWRVCRRRLPIECPKLEVSGHSCAAQGLIQNSSLTERTSKLLSTLEIQEWPEPGLQRTETKKTRKKPKNPKA